MFVQLVDVRNICMVERSQQLRFTLETRQPMRIFSQDLG